MPSKPRKWILGALLSFLWVFACACAPCLRQLRAACVHDTHRPCPLPRRLPGSISTVGTCSTCHAFCVVMLPANTTRYGAEGGYSPPASANFGWRQPRKPGNDKCKTRNAKSIIAGAKNGPGDTYSSFIYKNVVCTCAHAK